MPSIFIYALLSVLITSLVSLVGLIFFGIKADHLKKVLIYFVSFSAGALFGDTFLHLVPSIAAESGFTVQASLGILVGIVLMFVLEKIIHWHHCHSPDESKEHKHPVTYISLIGDATHNFIDGIIIAASYLISLPTGIATTIAVLLHEIPHELGNFSILIHGGFSRSRALIFNFMTATAAILGALLTLWFSTIAQNVQTILLPIAAGTFIYIAGSDLVPELHKHSDKISHSLLQLLAFLAGILIMALFLLLE